MKIQILIAAIISTLLFFFMFNLTFGFMPAVNKILLSLDYYLTWSLSIVDIALITVIPWIVFGLIRSGEKQTIKHQLALTALFLAGASVFFTFGFLLIALTPNENPLLPSYAKAQPFLHYWSLFFGLNNLLVSGMYLFDRKRKREQDVIDQKP